MNNLINATVIADSINEFGNRITTFELVFPRIILAELNTHRLFSRNSASSRAIPFHKMVESIKNNPFIPIAWQKDHSGMQGTEYLDEFKTQLAEEEWNRILKETVINARLMYSNGITKQICNRLLEPFMYHKVILTATEFDNFFELRCPSYEISGFTFKSKKDAIVIYPELKEVEDPFFWLNNNKGQAEIHMMDLAEKMWDAYNESTPKLLKAGEWHIPYGDNINLTNFTYFVKNEQNVGTGLNQTIEDIKVKIAVARCARVSYTNIDNNQNLDLFNNIVYNYEKDLQLYDNLAKSGHFSPFEHVAKCIEEDEYDSFIKGKAENVDVTRYFSDEDSCIMIDGEYQPAQLGWCNNYRGWIQQRWFLEND